MTTAVREKDVAETARATGAFDYLTKPLDPDHLIQYLDTVGSRLLTVKGPPPPTDLRTFELLR